MSEEAFEREGAAATLAQSSTRAGAMLKEAREAQGLHIAALAVGLKVSVQKLEALEAGRFNELPDMVFVRSLALSVCRSLKVDPTAIMASLPEPQASPFKASETSLNTTFKDTGVGSRRGLFSQVSTPIGFAVLALFVAIAVVLNWPETPAPVVDPTASGSTAELDAVTNQQETLSSVATASEVGLPSGDPLAPTMPTPANMPQETTSAVVAANATLANVTESSALAALPAVLELNGRGESWVEVKDATGSTKIRKILTKGEVIQVAGQLPLSVTVGRADAVSVSVRGKPFDLTPLVRENVARFEVK